MCDLLSNVSLDVSLQSKEDQTQVVSNLKTISMSSSKLLLAAKALSTDPSSPNLKNQLATAARSVLLRQTALSLAPAVPFVPSHPAPLLLLCVHSAVTDSINQLITMCTQQAPGQKECDNALRELEVRLRGASDVAVLCFAV